MSKNGWKVLFGIIPLAGDKNLTKGLREGEKEISTRNRVRSRRTSSVCRFKCWYLVSHSHQYSTERNDSLHCHNLELRIHNYEFHSSQKRSCHARSQNTQLSAQAGSTTASACKITTNISKSNTPHSEKTLICKPCNLFSLQYETNLQYLCIEISHGRTICGGLSKLGTLTSIGRGFVIFCSDA